VERRWLFGNGDVRLCLIGVKAAEGCSELSSCLPFRGIPSCFALKMVILDDLGFLVTAKKTL